jgi:hypothetical protein
MGGLVREPALDICMYCRLSDTKLTDEHIIPDGIGGNLVLPLSSCQKCASHFAQFEQHMVRHRFRLVRSALGIHSRKKKKKNYIRPETFHLYPGRPEALSLAKGIEHPNHANMPYLAYLESSGHEPSVLTGHHVQRSSEGRISSIIVKNVDMFAGNTMLGYGAANIGKTSRFIYKIAYGVAVTKLGLERFKPYVLDFLFDQSDLSLPQFVGESPFPANEARDILHKVELRVEDRPAHLLPKFPVSNRILIIADVYLFSLKPIRVIVGEIKA